LPALYSGALAYVSAVYHGGFDLPPAEALSCGTPVFVHNSPLHKEILGND
jgi:glycosyltransferase involved in cell wall biosynthesis